LIDGVRFLILPQIKKGDATMAWWVKEKQLRGLSEEAIGSVLAIGNGRFCVRGTPASAFAVPVAPFPFRGVYLAGFYTRAGWGLDHPMGAPDWTAAEVCVAGAAVPVLKSHRQLDLQQGLFVHEFEAGSGPIRLNGREERFASWARSNVGAQRLTLESLSTDPVTVQVRIGLDGDIRNSPSKLYKPGNPPNCDERGLKLAAVDSLSVNGPFCRVILRACSTGNRTGVVAAIRQVSGTEARVEEGSWAGLLFTVTLESGRPVVFEKVCMVSGDLPGYELAADDAKRADEVRYLDFASAWEEHQRAIASFWEVADVEIEGDPAAQQAVRYAVWCTRIAAGLDEGGSSIGPKNLTGDWYRGGVFWDMDLYQLPLLAAVCPDRAVNHIRYRFNRLPAGRVLAAQDGYDGARFPFTSFGDGFENPARVGGLAGQQVHINADVPWGILHTYALTGDERMLLDWGLPVLVAQARFWLSVIREPDASGRFHIRHICGPDELHSGVDDNTYTNVLVGWVLRATADLVEQMAARHPQEVARITGESEVPFGGRAGFGPGERARARQIADRMYLPHLPNGTPAPFEGFEKQPEPNTAIRNQWGAGDNTNKQADSLMLVQALPRQTERDWLQKVYDHDVPLCTQTSSLSPGTHVIAAVRLGRERDARRFWTMVAGMDLQDSFGNTAHGVHGAGQGGVWLAAVHGFGGLQVGLEGIALDPVLLPEWDRLAYTVFLRGARIHVAVRRADFEVTNRGPGLARFVAGGQSVELGVGESRRFAVQRGWGEARMKAVLFCLDGLWGPRVNGDAQEGGAGVGVDSSALSLLKALGAAGIRRAVVSGRTDVAAVLDRAGLPGEVDVVVGPDCFKQGFPKPEPFLIAAARCRALPWECVGVGLGPQQREAIQRAGCTAVVLPRRKGETTPRGSLADLTVPALESAFRTDENPLNPFLELNIEKMKTELKHG
jgi:trehalose/maltose hydrolase-like predicted phosphorylase